MLLIRPHPQTTDTLPSYLLRLTAANGYKNPMLLLRSNQFQLLNNRLPGKKIFFGYFDLERLAVLANITITQVEGLRFKHINNTRCLAFEQQFLVKSLNVSNLRVCPYCYGEKQTIAFINSLTVRTYCTKHNYPLISVHPATGKKLTWATNYFWRDAVSWGNNIPSVEIGEAEFQLNQQIESFETSRVIIERQKLNLAEYCDLLEFFAHFHQFAFGVNSNNQAKSDIKFSRQYYSAAYWYAAEWPARFFQLLEHFEDNPMSDNRITGIRKCFRDLYDDIYSSENKNSNAYKLLKSGFEEYLRDHFSNGILMQSLSQVGPQIKSKSRFISESQVAEVLCCHLGKVKVYVREKLLSSSHCLVNGTHIFFRADVMKLRVRLTNCCSICECAELLGISVYHARLLLRSNIISALLEPSTDNRDWLIEVKEIENLIKQLKANVTQSIKNSEHAKKRFAFSGCNFAELIKKMLCNKIQYGFSNNKSAPLSLEQFKPEFQANDTALNDLLTPKEACSTLGINKNVVYNFIKIGLLDCIKQQVEQTPRPIKLIPLASINHFKSSYLLRHQLSGTPLINFETISGPKINGGIINVYRRKQPIN
jgi:hypothetical protein